MASATDPARLICPPPAPGPRAAALRAEEFVALAGLLMLALATPDFAPAAPLQALAQSAAEERPVLPPSTRRLFSSMAALLLTGLLLLIFSIAAYLLIRVGRTVSQKPPAAKPTPYVDAWSQYRLGEEEVEAAMRNLREDAGLADERPPDVPPDPDAPEPKKPI